MEDYILKYILLGTVSWAVIFIFLRSLFPMRSFDFCNRIVSTIHATLAVTLASLTVKDWSCPICPLASKASPQQMQTLCVTMAYLVYDLICYLFDKKINLDNSVHHVVGIIGLGAGLEYQLCGSEMVAAVWITEISSPFLHMRELLRELGYRDTDLNFTADIVFAVIFSVARMIYGPYLTYVTLTANYPLVIKPAEEAGNGAKRMIEDGAIDNVEAIFVVHVSHQNPTSVIGSRPGPLLAGCGFFRAVISGKQGHAGNPQNSMDLILVGSAAVISLQNIISREANPLDSQVVSVASFSGGQNLDLIPESVILGGTFRAFSNASFYQVRQRIEEVCKRLHFVVVNVH